MGCDGCPEAPGVDQGFGRRKAGRGDQPGRRRRSCRPAGARSHRLHSDSGQPFVDARHEAANREAKVLPTSVSVPVTNQARFIGVRTRTMS